MRLRLALATVLAALGPAAAAQAATTVGSDLSKGATIGALRDRRARCFTGDTTTAAPAAVAPFDGVVVRWRREDRLGRPPLALRGAALRPATGTYTGVGRERRADT